jgi:hypothetical protein
MATVAEVEKARKNIRVYNQMNLVFMVSSGHRFVVPKEG